MKMSAEPPPLVVENLQTTFETKLGPVRAVDNISFSIQRGRTLGVVGESGCGKSVTALSIMGLVDYPGRVTSGRILFHGQDLGTLSEKDYQDLRGRKIAMIFQEPMTAFNPVLSIGYQIDEQIRHHLKLSRAKSRARSIKLLRRVGIPAPEEQVGRYPHQLSGGMRQRAMIAMALSCDPELLIADEPTTALDVTIQAQILQLMRSLKKEMNMAIQFITHDLGVISEMADDVMVMYAGKVCEKAPTGEIFKSPRHPYTVGLMKSIPLFGKRVDRLSAIEGTVPSLLELTGGCPFQNRCPNAGDRCKETMPPLETVAEGHELACFHPSDQPS